MTSRILQEEKKLWQKGFKRVACLDEAGRGCLGGPVVATAAVMLNSKVSYIKQPLRLLILEINDSKKLSPIKREKLYKVITKSGLIEWGIGKISEKMIDKINILEATKLAMIKAIKKLKINPDFLILDGKMKLNLPLPQKSIIKADEKVFSCMASSIIAKKTRDRIMERYHKKYPQYGFNQHKGYPTKLHRRMLKKYGPCKIHRRSFKPVFDILKIKNSKNCC